MKILYKIIALPLSIIFLIQNIGWTAPSASPQSVIHNLHSIYISEQYGKIEQVHLSPKSPKVILVKDAHCNYEAQTNIAKILDTLIRDYKIDLVAVEGAAGSVNPQILLSSNPDKALVKKVTNKYLKTGLLTASEALSANSGKEPGFSIWGVEDLKLYLEDYKAFRNVVNINNTGRYFTGITANLVSQLKNKIYFDKLKKFDGLIIKYEADKLPLSKLIQTLHTNYGIPKIYKNLKLVLRSIRLEGKINFKKVDYERTGFIKELEKTMPKEDLQGLIKQSLLFKLGKIPAFDYYTYLESLPCRQTPSNLQKYIHLVKLQNKINETALFSELEDAVENIYNKLCTDKASRSLHQLDKDIKILSKMLSLEATRENLSYFKKNQSRFTPEKLLEFIKIQAPINNIPLPFELNNPSFIEETRKAIIPAEEFYNLAIKRDTALVENLIRTMEKNKKDKAVLVCGGFHAEGMNKLLQEKGISTAIITPSITKTQEDSREIYLKRMLDERINPEKMLNELGQENLSPVVATSPQSPEAVIQSVLTDLRKLYPAEKIPGELSKEELSKLLNRLYTQAIQADNRTLIAFLDGAARETGITLGKPDEAPPTTLKAPEDAGLCVTGDTLLPLLAAKEMSSPRLWTGGSSPLDSPAKRGNDKEGGFVELKPIVDVKSGDYVLSLNEETQKIEPHRIKGLLDMGVKPVCRLTTASGRSIKTTANHPYYVKMSNDKIRMTNEYPNYKSQTGRWIKVSELRAGDEIAVPRLMAPDSNSFGLDYKKAASQFSFSNAFEESNSSIDNLFSGHIFDINNNYACRIFYSEADYIPEVFIESEKYFGMFKNIREYISVIRTSHPFIYCPFNFKTGFNKAVYKLGIDTMIGKNLHNNLFLHNDLRRFFAQDRSEFNCGNDILFGNTGILRRDFINRVAGANQIQDVTYGYPGSFNAGFSESYIGINRNPILQRNFMHYYHLQKLLYCVFEYMSNLLLLSKAEAAEIDEVSRFQSSKVQNDILWDKIVSIEYIGREHVYDIEVEGTHNFIGNGIFAHNTYLPTPRLRQAGMQGKKKTAHMESLQIRKDSPYYAEKMRINNADVDVEDIKRQFKNPAAKDHPVEYYVNKLNWVKLSYSGTFELDINGKVIQVVQINYGGKAFYISKDVLNTFGIQNFLEILENVIREIPKGASLPKNIYILNLSGSPHMFEDHIGNGFIGINQALLDLFNNANEEDKKYLSRLFQTGLEHELLHETGEIDENKLKERDAKRLWQLNLSSSAVKQTLKLIDGIAIVDEDFKIELILNIAGGVWKRLWVDKPIPNWRGALDTQYPYSDIHTKEKGTGTLRDYLKIFFDHGFLLMPDLNTLAENSIDDAQIGDALYSSIIALGKTPPGSTLIPLRISFDPKYKTHGFVEHRDFSEIPESITINVNNSQATNTFLHELAHYRWQKTGQKGHLELRECLENFLRKAGYTGNIIPSMVHELVAYTAASGNVWDFIEYLWAKYKINNPLPETTDVNYITFNDAVIHLLRVNLFNVPDPQSERPGAVYYSWPRCDEITRLLTVNEGTYVDPQMAQDPVEQLLLNLNIELSRHGNDLARAMAEKGILTKETSESVQKLLNKLKEIVDTNKRNNCYLALKQLLQIPGRADIFNLELLINIAENSEDIQRGYIYLRRVKSLLNEMSNEPQWLSIPLLTEITKKHPENSLLSISLMLDCCTEDESWIDITEEDIKSIIKLRITAKEGLKTARFLLISEFTYVSEIEPFFRTLENKLKDKTDEYKNNCYRQVSIFLQGIFTRVPMMSCTDILDKLINIINNSGDIFRVFTLLNSLLSLKDVQLTFLLEIINRAAQTKTPAELYLQYVLDNLQKDNLQDKLRLIEEFLGATGINTKEALDLAGVLIEKNILTQESMGTVKELFRAIENQGEAKTACYEKLIRLASDPKYNYIFKMDLLTKIALKKGADEAYTALEKLIDSCPDNRGILRDKRLLIKIAENAENVARAYQALISISEKPEIDNVDWFNIDLFMKIAEAKEPTAYLSYLNQKPNTTDEVLSNLLQMNVSTKDGIELAARFFSLKKTLAEIEPLFKKIEGLNTKDKKMSYRILNDILNAISEQGIGDIFLNNLFLILLAGIENSINALRTLLFLIENPPDWLAGILGNIRNSETLEKSLLFLEQNFTDLAEKDEESVDRLLSTYLSNSTTPRTLKAPGSKTEATLKSEGQIGKKATVVGIEGDNAIIDGDQIWQKKLQITEKEVNIENLKNKIEAMDILPKYKEILIAMIDSIPKDQMPKFYTFNELVNDLFGFVYTKDNKRIIGLFNEIADNPIAVIHEIGHIWMSDNEERINQIFSVLEPKWRAWYENKIAIYGDSLKTHYALRAFQQQVFGEMDTELTEYIRRRQENEQKNLFSRAYKILYDYQLSLFSNDEIRIYARGIVELNTAAGKEPYELFAYGLPVVKELFTAEEFREYWPDLVRLGIAAGVNARNLIQSGLPTVKKLFTADEFREYWTDLVQLGITAGLKGMNVYDLFYYSLPIVKDLITNREQLQKIGNDLMQLGTKAGANVEYILKYGLPVVKDLITNREELQKIGNDLVQLGIAAGKNANSLFENSLPAAKKLFTAEEFREYWPGLLQLFTVTHVCMGRLCEDGLSVVRKLFTAEKFREYWPDLVRLVITAGGNSTELFKYGLPAVKDLITSREELQKIGNDLVQLGKTTDETIDDLRLLFEFALRAVKKPFTSEEFRKYWPDLARLGIEAGKNNAVPLFLNGLPAVRHLINNRDDLNKIGKELLKILQQVKGTEEQTMKAIKELMPLLQQYPSSFNTFIKPIIYDQTIGAFLCLEAVKKIWKLGAIQSETDLEYIKEFIIKHNIMAYDLLENFIIAGIKQGIISKPISIEKETISNYLRDIGYPIPEIYKVYKDNPAKAQDLKERCMKIHQAILKGNTQKFENDSFFSAMLMYVFPPEVTTQRDQYMNLYKQHPDRPNDTKDIPQKLQGAEFTVKTGNYTLKDPAKPLDTTHWHTIITAVQTVNKEEKPIIKETEAEEIGDLLLHTWAEGKFEERRQEIYTRIYRYYTVTRGQKLPDGLTGIGEIMALKEFIGDTMRDIIQECIDKYKGKNNTGYENIINRIVAKGINNPRGKSKGIMSIWDRYGKDSEEAKKNIRNVLNEIEDGDLFEQVYKQILKKQDQREINEILSGIRFEVSHTKISILILHKLQGNEYKSMQSEVTEKYEFQEGEKDIELKTIVSKRKAHGTAGLNMGVCVAPDKQLWDNPNFMNVILFDKNDIAQGGMHILIIEDNGKKYLTLPGINPSTRLLTKVAGDDIYNKLIEYAKQIAIALKYDAVLIPTSSVIHSNRSEIQRVIAGKAYKAQTLSKVHQFSYSPHKYSFQDCYIAVSESEIKNELTKETMAAAPTSVTLKAPGSIGLDEDSGAVKDHIEKIIREAQEETHPSPDPLPNGEKAVFHVLKNEGELKDQLGIPRFKGAAAPQDLVYAYGKNIDGKLHIYVTEAFWTVLQKDSVMLAFLIDHEYQENILGKTHAEASQRAWLPEFVGKYGMNPFYEFYINQLADIEDIESLSKLTVEHPNDPKGIFRNYVIKTLAVNILPKLQIELKTAVEAGDNTTALKILSKLEQIHNVIKNLMTENSTLSVLVFEKLKNILFDILKQNKEKDEEIKPVNLMCISLPMARLNAKGYDLANRVKINFYEKVKEYVKKKTPKGKEDKGIRVGLDKELLGQDYGFSKTRLFVVGLTESDFMEIKNLLKETLAEEKVESPDSYNIYAGHALVDLNKKPDIIENFENGLLGKVSCALENMITDAVKETTGRAEAAEKHTKTFILGESDKDLLSRYSEQIRNGRNKFIPENEYKTGKIPRFSHQLGRLDKTFKDMKGDMNENNLNNYIRCLNKNILYSLQDARYRKAYKKDSVAAVLMAWEDGTLDKYAGYLREEGMTALADEWQNPLKMTKMGDEIWLYARDKNGKIIQMFLELDKFNAFNEQYPPDAGDSLYHRILDSISNYYESEDVKGNLDAFAKGVENAILDNIIKIPQDEIYNDGFTPMSKEAKIDWEGREETIESIPVLDETIFPKRSIKFRDQVKLRNLKFHHTEKFKGQRVPVFTAVNPGTKIPERKFVVYERRIYSMDGKDETDEILTLRESGWELIPFLGTIGATVTTDFHSLTSLYSPNTIANLNTYQKKVLRKKTKDPMDVSEITAYKITAILEKHDIPKIDEKKLAAAIKEAREGKIYTDFMQVWNLLTGTDMQHVELFELAADISRPLNALQESEAKTHTAQIMNEILKLVLEELPETDRKQIIEDNKLDNEKKLLETVKRIAEQKGIDPDEIQSIFDLFRQGIDILSCDPELDVGEMDGSYFALIDQIARLTNIEPGKIRNAFKNNFGINVKMAQSKHIEGSKLHKQSRLLTAYNDLWDDTQTVVDAMPAGIKEKDKSAMVVFHIDMFKDMPLVGLKAVLNSIKGSKNIQLGIRVPKTAEKQVKEFLQSIWELREDIVLLPEDISEAKKQYPEAVFVVDENYAVPDNLKGTKIFGVSRDSAFHAVFAFGIMYARAEGNEVEGLLNHFLKRMNYTDEEIRKVKEEYKQNGFFKLKLIRIAETLQEFQNRKIFVETAA